MNGFAMARWLEEADNNLPIALPNIRTELELIDGCNMEDHSTPRCKASR